MWPRSDSNLLRICYPPNSFPLMQFSSCADFFAHWRCVPFLDSVWIRASVEVSLNSAGAAALTWFPDSPLTRTTRPSSVAPPCVTFSVRFTNPPARVCSNNQVLPASNILIFGHCLDNMRIPKFRFLWVHGQQQAIFTQCTLPTWNLPNKLFAINFSRMDNGAEFCPPDG